MYVNRSRDLEGVHGPKKRMDLEERARLLDCWRTDVCEQV